MHQFLACPTLDVDKAMIRTRRKDEIDVQTLQRYCLSACGRDAQQRKRTKRVQTRSALGISTTGNCGLYTKKVFRDLGIRPAYPAMEDHESACLQDLTLTYKTVYASAAKFENVCARERSSGYPKSLSITRENQQPSPSIKLPLINWKLRAIVHLCHFETQHAGLRLALRTVHPPIYVHTPNKHSTASRAPLHSARFGWIQRIRHHMVIKVTSEAPGKRKNECDKCGVRMETHIQKSRRTRCKEKVAQTRWLKTSTHERGRVNGGKYCEETSHRPDELELPSKRVIFDTITWKAPANRHSSVDRSP
ncbi:hypothetical protein EV424DRAFT_1594682 [Suillus variegatus]|nr:hypothetical protein EV424DRAFT_1594682 [Suillus variegatus]